MKGSRLLYFTALLLTIVCGQGNGNDKGKGNGNDKDKGGCCFYSSIDYDENKIIACTNQPFRREDLDNKEGIMSFHCTESFAAEIFDRRGRMEEASCGDEVGETTQPMDYHNITIAECLQRRCCFYTGKNKDGNEFCMFSDAALPEDLSESQKESKFAVGECISDWQATLHAARKQPIVIGCGVTLDLPSETRFDRITLQKCSTPAVARAEYETVDEFFTDAAYTDTLDQTMDSFQADQLDAAVFDSSVSLDAVIDPLDGVETGTLDQYVDPFQAEQVDAAVVDPEFQNEVFTDANENFDQALAMDAFDQTFENDEYTDFATDVQGNSFSSASAVLGSLLSIVAVFALVF